MATVISYNMEEFIDSCVSRYCELAGVARVREWPTPFIPESHEESLAAAPRAKGEVVERPWCCHTFPPTVHSSVHALEEYRRSKSKRAPAVSDGSRNATSTTRPGPSGVGDGDSGEDRGKLGSIAARVLVEILGSRASHVSTCSGP